MKTILLAMVIAEVVGAPLGALERPIPQAIVSTGRVISVSKETGTVSLRSEQSVRTLVFRGLWSAPVYYGGGRRASFDAIVPGRPATIYYSPRGDRWLIQKVVVPESAQAGAASTATTVRRRWSGPPFSHVPFIVR